MAVTPTPIEQFTPQSSVYFCENPKLSNDRSVSVNDMAFMSRDNQSEPPVILCISDDTAHLNNIRRNLSQAGFSVITTRSSADAIDLTLESDIDALLCDYDLPQMDAISLFEQIRLLHGDRTPPTLVISEYEADTISARCTSAGIEGLHVKSGSAESLVNRVTSMIRNDTKRFHVEQVSGRRQLKGGTDPLTNIASKAHFMRRFNAESNAAYRDQSAISLLVLMVDRYERLVDTIGRQKSDNLLARIARLIEGDLRSRDCVARFANHTFTVILPDTPREAAEAVGRRLRRKVAATEFGDLDQPIAATVSVGCTCRPPGTRFTTDELITQAVRSCSAAQALGGDRIVSDTALTGKPLVLLVGDPSWEVDAMATELEKCSVEIRLADSFAVARDILKKVPVAVVVTENTVQKKEAGIHLLSWVRNNYGAVHRILITDKVDATLMEIAVNDAGIHCFIPTPIKKGKLAKVIDSMLFT